jgi:allophanate hydrolase
MSFERLSVADIVASLKSGEATAVAVCTDALARVSAYEAVQPAVWIERFDDAVVLEKAAEVDRRLAAGEDLPLAGVPFAVKDNIDVAGLPTTAGCPAFAYRPQAPAFVVARLEAAGAIPIGKTNLDQFATGLVGTRSPFGEPRCVYNLDYVSGGSSSGSAVATAAGLVAFALGTDTAGSGRVPAAFNHLVGLKPTKGRWSNTGLVPACKSLDCITVFASTVEDAALVDAVAAAFDALDTYSRRHPGRSEAEDRDPGDRSPPSLLGHGSDLRSFRDDEQEVRVGVPLPHQQLFLGDAESAGLYTDAIARARDLGAAIVEIDIQPLLDCAQLLYSGPWVAERTAAAEPLLRSNPAAIHPVVRGIMLGGLNYSAVDAFNGQYALKAYERAAEAVWDAVDVLLLPTCPTAYTVRELLAEPVALNANLGLYTNFVNLLDMSAIALPAGFRANGTGFGVTFVAPAWADLALQDLARVYERASPITPPALDLQDKSDTGVTLAVVGAHLGGMPLHWQLTCREAELVARTRTAPAYSLHAIANTTPPKPALVHVGEGGASIEVEVYRLSTEAFGSFVVEVPPPLAIGTVALEDGSTVKGFVAEPRALEGAEDITSFGGWRAYIAAR